MPVILEVDATCSEIAPEAVVVAIDQDGVDALLSWEDDSANKGGYQIHRNNSPYFSPDASTKIGSPLPVGATEYRDAGAVGNPASNYFYIVQALRIANRAKRRILDDWPNSTSPSTPAAPDPTVGFRPSLWA